MIESPMATLSTYNLYVGLAYFNHLFYFRLSDMAVSVSS